MIRGLRILVGAALLVWASWMGWLLGYAAGERDADDRDAEATRGLPAERVRGERGEVDWQAGTPSDDLAAKAEVVREGTGWGVPARAAS